MAKRRSTQQTPEQKHAALMKRRTLSLALLWVFIIVVDGLFGYSHGYPLVAEGQVMQGILIGLAYGGGALLLIVVALFVNRKLRGL